jgi:hypothetical protein
MGWFKRRSKAAKVAEKQVNAAQKDPTQIGAARQAVLGEDLSNSERIELLEKLNAAPRYRNQRDNSKSPDSTCNFTSMAMAFEGLGMNVGDTATTQGEEAIYKDFYGKGNSSRIDGDQRERYAKQRGLKSQTIDTPTFTNAAAAKKWFETHITPHMQAGAQATLGIQQGSFRHIIRLQWVEDKGLRVDDPWGHLVGMGEKGIGYAEKNGTKRDSVGDQAGSGNDNFMDWASVATAVSDRYVQLYQTQ